MHSYQTAVELSERTYPNTIDFWSLFLLLDGFVSGFIFWVIVWEFVFGGIVSAVVLVVVAAALLPLAFWICIDSHTLYLSIVVFLVFLSLPRNNFRAITADPV